MWFGNYNNGFGNYDFETMRCDLETGNIRFGNYDLETKTRDLETITADWETMIWKLRHVIWKLGTADLEPWFGNYEVWFANLPWHSVMTRSKRFNFDDLLIYVLFETAWKRRMVLLRGVKKINWHRMSFMSDVNVLSVLTFPQRTKLFHLVVESIDGTTKTSCFAIAIPICNCLVCQQRPKLRVCKNNSTQNSVRRLSAPQGEV